MSLSRRTFCLSLAWFSAWPGSMALAKSAINLQWADLIPKNAGQPPAPVLQGRIPHSQASLAAMQPKSSGVRSEWNDKFVSLSGFIVPLEFSGTGLSMFILVPYVGACIHVPPPPANQLVLVSTKDPYESRQFSAPVTVTGRIITSETKTDLAEIGYSIEAKKIELFRE